MPISNPFLSLPYTTFLSLSPHFHPTHYSSPTSYPTNLLPVTTFLSLYPPYSSLNPPLSLKLHSYLLNPFPSILLSFTFSIHFLVHFLSRLSSCMHGHLTSPFLSIPNLHSFSIHHALRSSSISSTSLPCIPIFLSHVCHHLHETLHHHFSHPIPLPIPYLPYPLTCSPSLILSTFRYPLTHFIFHIPIATLFSLHHTTISISIL